MFFLCVWRGFTASKTESPTSTNRSRGHRSVDVGDSDLEAVKPHFLRRCFTAHVRPSCRRIFGEEERVT
ncbi:MAG: hypothetical protein K2H92_05410 [Bacteroidaceae bacterium]|nr:hypothetical protein [Bacteroidaceae bacterium]